MTDDREDGGEKEDLTGTVGSATDIAPVGYGAAKPPHELTAHEGIDAFDWHGITLLPHFKAMIRAKVRFVLPATVFFVVYYFALPVLVGYAPRFMAKKVFGNINLAYLFALSEFFMAWIIAGLYLRAAARFDVMERGIVDEAIRRTGEKRR